MENLKIVSIRLDPENIQKISDYCRLHPYWTRSSFINRLLSNVFNCSAPGALTKLMETYDPFSAGLTIHVVKDNKNL